jgi:4-hydroxythreonine-4-phosphate dehydrogenase
MTPVSRRPILAFTVGDLAGVGPELILRAWPSLCAVASPVVYGSAAWLAAAREDLLRRGVATDLPRVVEIAADAPFPSEPSPQAVPVLSVGSAARRPTSTQGAYPWGQAVKGFGWWQHEALVRAVADAQRGRVDGIVTAPWHKKRLADDDLPPTGHTEVLQREAGGVDVLMVLAGDRLRVGLVTTHIPLRDVADAVTGAAIERAARLLDRGLRDLWGVERPRIAVCGLNPHAGEQGVLGHEDADVIAPAIARLVAEGLSVDGPWPADTIFPRVVAGMHATDAVLAMYHDQGLGPLKTACFSRAANVTVGLPFIRTSVDHGTAYDIAGTGTARIDSLCYATELACSFVRVREARASMV